MGCEKHELQVKKTIKNSVWRGIYAFSLADRRCWSSVTCWDRAGAQPDEVRGAGNENSAFEMRFSHIGLNNELGLELRYQN